MTAEGNPNATKNNQRNDTKKTKKPAGDNEVTLAAEAAAGMGIMTDGDAATPTGLAGSAIGAGASGDPTKINTGNEGPSSGNPRDKNKPSR